MHGVVHRTEDRATRPEIRRVIKSVAVAVAIGLCSVGCGEKTTPSPPPVAEAPVPEQDWQQRMTMQGVDLYLYDKASRGESEQPRFQIHADQATRDADGSHRFEGAQATYFSGKGRASDVVFRADRGYLREGEEAYLEGAVSAETSAVQITLEDVYYETTESAGVAYSDKPVRLNGPNIHLMAAALRLYSDTRTLLLSGVSGEITFGSGIL